MTIATDEVLGRIQARLRVLIERTTDEKEHCQACWCSAIGRAATGTTGRQICEYGSSQSLKARPSDEEPSLFTVRRPRHHQHAGSECPLPALPRQLYAVGPDADQLHSTSCDRQPAAGAATGRRNAPDVPELSASMQRPTGWKTNPQARRRFLAAGPGFLHGRTRFCNPDGSSTTGRPLRPIALIAWSPADADHLAACKLSGVLLRDWSLR